MTKLKLIKGLSYTGHGVSVSASSPFVEVNDENRANALAGSGYFSIVAEAPGASAPNTADEKPLEKMTEKELESYAAENGIDISGLTRKADKLSAILQAEAEAGALFAETQ